MTSVFQRRRNSRWTQEDTPNNNGNPGSSPGNPTLPLQPVTGLARRNTNDNFFPPGGARNVQATPAGGLSQPGMTHDSLTLGQLKAANAAGQPKEKVSLDTNSGHMDLMSSRNNMIIVMMIQILS